MSQEGANLPQEVEGSHDQATAPHISIPAGIGSPAATVSAGSNSSYVSKLASAVNSAGSSELASPAVLSAGKDKNVASSKIASPTTLHTDEDHNALPKIASPAVLLTGGENKAEFKLASTAVIHSGVEKGNHAGLKLASPAVLHAGDGTNGGSKIASPAVPQATLDNTTGSKVDSPTVLHAADEHNNAGFKVPNPAALHAKDMDNNARQPKFASPGSVLLHVGEENRARTKLAIQAVSHAGGNVGSSRLTRSAAAAAAAAATKDNASKLAIQVVPTSPHADKDNNAGSSMAATRLVAVDAGGGNTNKGKNNVAGEQRVPEADVGSSRGKGNTAAVEDADPNLHIFTERERRKKMKNMFSTLHGLLPSLPNKADKSTIVGETVIYIKTLERTLERLQKLKMERERQRALAAQQQQQVLVGCACSSRVSCPRHPAPAPAAASSSREAQASLADIVHGLQAAANNALVTAQAAAAAAAGAGGSSSSVAGGDAQLPRGTVPFPAPAAGFQTWTGPNAVVSVANNEAYINLRCPREIGTLTRALFVLERNNIEVVTTTISTQDGFRMYGIHARVNPASASAGFPENLCAEDRFKLAVSEMLEMIKNA